MIREMTDFVKTRKMANFAMVCLNIGVFLVLAILGNDYSVGFMYEHGAMYAPAVEEGGAYYRLFTSMFLHFGFEHLAYNMLILVFAGDMLERQVGAIRYLIIYLGGGLAGSFLSYAVALRQDAQAISAGASGAVFAVIGALIYIVLRNKGKVKGIDGRGLCLMATLSLIQGFMDMGVDPYAHLGGAVGGFVLAILLYHGRDRTPWEPLNSGNPQ